MYCTNCGKKNDSDSQFCMDCGMPLTQSVTEVSSPSPYFQIAEPFDGEKQSESVSIPKKKKTAVAMICMWAAVSLAVVSMGVALFVRGANKRHLKQRYDYVQGDYTREQAQQMAAEQGGHLARFETRKAFDAAVEDLPKDSQYWIGAHRDSSGEGYVWDGEVEGSLNDPDSWANDLWLENEPSYGGDDAVAIRYSETEHRWGFCDVPSVPHYIHTDETEDGSSDSDDDNPEIEVMSFLIDFDTDEEEETPEEPEPSEEEAEADTPKEPKKEEEPVQPKKESEPKPEEDTDEATKYQPYRKVIRDIEQRIGYSGLNPVYKGDCLGQLIDLDGDKTDELVLCYIVDMGHNIVEIWTIQNNEAKKLLEENWSVYAGAGPNCALYDVSVDGKPGVVRYDTYGETFTANKDWFLYQFEDGKLTQKHFAKYYYEEDYTLLDELDYDELPSTTTYYLDDEEIPEEDYEKLPWTDLTQEPILSLGYVPGIDEDGEVKNTGRTYEELLDAIPAEEVEAPDASAYPKTADALLDELTKYYFITSYQCIEYYRFFEDGTYAQYFYNTYDDPDYDGHYTTEEYLELEKTEKPNTYEVKDGKIYLYDNEWNKTILIQPVKLDDNIHWASYARESASRLIQQDEYFFHEVSEDGSDIDFESLDGDSERLHVARWLVRAMPVGAESNALPQQETKQEKKPAQAEQKKLTKEEAAQIAQDYCGMYAGTETKIGPESATEEDFEEIPGMTIGVFPAGPDSINGREYYTVTFRASGTWLDTVYVDAYTGECTFNP